VSCCTPGVGICVVLYIVYVYVLYTGCRYMCCVVHYVCVCVV